MLIRAPVLNLAACDINHELCELSGVARAFQGLSVICVIRRGAATSAVKAIAEFGHENPETDGNEIDTNVLVALAECPPVRLRKLDDAGLSTFRAF